MACGLIQTGLSTKHSSPQDIHSLSTPPSPCGYYVDKYPYAIVEHAPIK